jgi:hypothetical protein
MPKSMPTDLVYIFSSRSRVAYARDILNITCLPCEIVYLFRYYYKFVPTPLRQSAGLRSALDGKEAIIVFADIVEGASGKEYRFVPIRRARLLDPRIVGSVVYVPFQLKEFIDLGRDASLHTKLDAEIKALADVPKFSADPKESGSFIVSAPRIDLLLASTTTDDESQQRAWESIVERLTSTANFKFSTFYRIRSMKSGPKNLQPLIAGGTSEYPLSGNETLSITLSFFHSRNPIIERRRLKLVANADLFSGDIDREIPADLPYNDVTVRLLARRSLESQLTSVSFVPQSWAPNPAEVLSMNRALNAGVAEELTLEAVQKQAAELELQFSSGTFIAPFPELVIRLGIPWRTVLFVAMLFLLGNIGLAANTEWVSAIGVVLSIEGLQQFPGTWAVFMRTGGALAFLLATVYVFRRLPIK